MLDTVMVPIHLQAEAPPLHEVGGVLRVGDTGVTLETVVWTFHAGASPEAIVDQFPTLEPADVYDVIAYYLRHREDVDRYLTARQSEYARAVDGLEAAIPPTALQNRLRSRRP